MATETTKPLTPLIDLLFWLDGPIPEELWFRGQPRAWIPEPAVLRGPVEQALRTRELARIARLQGTRPREFDSFLNSADPSVLANAERRLNHEFIRHTAFTIAAPQSNIDAYFLAQHHRLATRLLDWTVHPLTALHFAVGEEGDSHASEDAVIYALDPVHQVNVAVDATTAIPLSNPFVPDHEVVQNVITALFATETVQDVLALGQTLTPIVDTPIAVQPNLAAGRMFAQGSCFTLHPPGCPGFRDGLLTSIPIRAMYKPRIRHELRRLGITHASLFPDADSAVRDIKERWRLP